MTVTDRTDASDAEFRARFDRFGIFDEERVVEVVARALWVAEGRHPDDWGSPLRAFIEQQARLRTLAVAAVAAYRAQADR